MTIVISKVKGPTALATTASTTQLDAADSNTPEWAAQLLGVRMGAVTQTPTSTQACFGYGYLQTGNFMPNPNNIPWIASGGAAATTNNLAAMPLEYWPMNYPIHGGDAYSFYMFCSTVNTVAPYGSAEVTFADGNSDKGPGGRVPARFDPYPDIVRFYEHAGATAEAATTQNLTTLTITGSKAISELWGYNLAPTNATASKPRIGKFVFTSTGFYTSPVEMGVEVQNGFLGTNVVGGSPPKITRMDHMQPVSNICIITPSYVQAGAFGATTDYADAGVAFIRDWAPVEA